MPYTEDKIRLKIYDGINESNKHKSNGNPIALEELEKLL
jgi:hypothetical protein